ncbi:aminoglycoside phosphotransferase family protein [Streptomyces sp. CWNU-1]|uniref:Aminoglycoside phosphotransferase family protein n=2 Tax=Streptomyces albipurpureus TaxID=2897419 RepID=A0ABT0UTB1_9ACTN|nr:aminoglycoside phosphotransferase family protein [Streptomyces sp. CWNU-1]
MEPPLLNLRSGSASVVVNGKISSSGPQGVAAEILRRYDVDLTRAQRGRGWTNATWLTDELAIRVAPKPQQSDLLREARLVRLLPPEVGCPTIVEAGVLHGHEWVLTRRLAGENLEEIWPSLDHTARAEAIEQMWERARHIHGVDVVAAAPHTRSRSPFFPGSVQEARATLDRLIVANELTTAQARGLSEALDRFWAALPGVPKALNHGDLCTPNTLWHSGRVIALLDFEFAVIAPIAIDLNEVVKTAFGPGDPAERAPLQDVVHRIAAASLDAAGGPDVLIGYSIMLEMWLLENELAAEAPNATERAASAAMLTAFATGDGGYFAPLLDDIL